MRSLIDKLLHKKKLLKINNFTELSMAEYKFKAVKGSGSCLHSQRKPNPSPRLKLSPKTQQLNLWSIEKLERKKEKPTEGVRTVNAFRIFPRNIFTHTHIF